MYKNVFTAGPDISAENGLMACGSATNGVNVNSAVVAQTKLLGDFFSGTTRASSFDIDQRVPAEIHLHFFPEMASIATLGWPHIEQMCRFGVIHRAKFLVTAQTNPKSLVSLEMWIRVFPFCYVNHYISMTPKMQSSEHAVVDLSHKRLTLIFRPPML